MRRDGDRDGGVDSRQLLDRDRIGDRVASRAPVLLGDRHPHQPQLGHLADELDGEAGLAVELLGHRCNALAREGANGVPDQLLVGGEIEVHAAGMLVAAHALVVATAHAGAGGQRLC